MEPTGKSVKCQEISKSKTSLDSRRGSHSQAGSDSQSKGPESVDDHKDQPHRWSVRSRSFDKHREWGQYAARICAERQLRRELQAELELVSPCVWAQQDCPWCWTRGWLLEWEQWAQTLTEEAAAEEETGWTEVGGVTRNSQSQPSSGLWRLPAPIPWCNRGKTRDPHYPQ